MTLRIEHDAPLGALNSFGVAARATTLLTIRCERELPALIEALRGQPHFHVLGAGNNVVLATRRYACVLRVALAGRRILSDSAQAVRIEAAAGEDWHSLVEWTVSQGLSGLENLALIPGTVGAAPIQNIGAYGVELAESFESLDAIDLQSGARRRFDRAACRFSYRDSVFKREEGRRWLILSVRLALSRSPRACIDYADLRAEFARSGAQPTPRAIADAVIRIRRAKLPDPARIGNAGSFFKNPVVDAAEFARLRDAFPALPGYPGDDGRFKLPAAWLIEQAGWKGRRAGDAGVHERHALVLVNHGGASGAELIALSEAIRESVQQRFGIRLEPEPVVWRD